MRKTVLTLLVLLVLPATANASGKLWLKQARAVTAKEIKLNLRAGGAYYPDHVTATPAACTRRSRTRATCKYTLAYESFTKQSYSTMHYFAATCPHTVRVRMYHGRPLARPVYTACYPPPPASDYEE